MTKPMALLMVAFATAAHAEHQKLKTDISRRSNH
jgi:hypothetical protein